MYFLIYKISNRLDNKFYVGKHKTENKKDDYFGSGLLLKRAVEKHGKENFTKEILFECASLEEMNQKETDIVDEEFIARPDTYNIMLGGQGGFGYVNTTGKNIYNNHDIISKKHQILAVEARNKKWEEDPNFRNEILQKLLNASALYRSVHGNNTFKGKHHTDDAKKSIGEKNTIHQKGKGNSQFGTHWITNGTENRKQKKDVPLTDGWRKGRI